MAKDKKIYMPMGMGGLIRYTEEEKVFIKLKPKHVIAIIFCLVIIEILLKIFIPL
jgi:preprotein translocase subunit Sec61beta